MIAELCEKIAYTVPKAAIAINYHIIKAAHDEVKRQ